MSKTPDETARAIADCRHVDFFNFDPLYKQDRFTDLQAMARFWLMKEEILGHLHYGERPDQQDELRDRIEQL